MAKARPPPEPDLERLLADLGRELSRVGAELKTAVEQATAPVRDRAEVEFAKVVAEHPDLYRQVRRTLREIGKTADEAAKAFGLKAKDP
jgi:hypothetical protein